MFTGIIEQTAPLVGIETEGENVHFTLQTPLAAELKIDQSLAHDGVCLTVVGLDLAAQTYRVTAVKETLLRTNLGQWKLGKRVNLERAMQLGARLDGHIVQGHVDLVGYCKGIEEVQGSWYFHFEYPANPDYLLVNKGSVCINGVSLTVVNPTANTFSVAIIPYTYAHTNFNQIQVGDAVNLEFDVLGKYVSKYLHLFASPQPQ
jgi:riboflavin synthase